MFTTKLNFLGPLVLALLVVTVATIEPTFAQPAAPVPGPVVGAGLLPPLAIVAGGHWLIRRVRGRR